MLLDIEQTPNQVIISYYNKEGNVSFKRYPISQYTNWEICDKKDRNVHKTFKNWNGRPIKKSPSKYFNKFSLLYFLDNLPTEDQEEIFEFNIPRIYFVDIETEIIDGFPDPKDANSRILTISIITPERKSVVLGLEDLSANQIKQIETDTNQYFKNFDQDWEFSYFKFSDEYNLLYTFLYKFLPKIPMMTGWNFINYDWTYIVNRCKKLNIDLEQATITKRLERNDTRPMHMGLLDYMQLYDKYDRSVKVKESNTLDYVAGQVLNINKIKFMGSLQDLYRDNFQKYVYYNVVDSILVYYIDQKIKSMEVLLTLASITRMPLYKAASPVAVTEALMVRKLSELNLKVGIDGDSSDNDGDESYVGAYVKEPVRGYYKGVSAFDFASLYPSIMRQFNISPDSYVKIIPKNEIKDAKDDKNFIVCENGVIYKKEDSILKQILSDLYSQRKEYKKLSYEYFTKAQNLRKRLKNKN